jgi:hypothetical protein
MIYAFVSNT